MSTKANPGKYDCYAAADDNEPMFILLARDPTAPYLVELWRQMRAGVSASMMEETLYDAIKALAESNKKQLSLNSNKSLEAIRCSNAMVDWWNQHRGSEDNEPT